MVFLLPLSFPCMKHERRRESESERGKRKTERVRGREKVKGSTFFLLLSLSLSLLLSFFSASSRTGKSEIFYYIHLKRPGEVELASPPPRVVSYVIRHTSIFHAIHAHGHVGTLIISIHANRSFETHTHTHMINLPFTSPSMTLSLSLFFFFPDAL